MDLRRAAVLGRHRGGQAGAQGADHQGAVITDYPGAAAFLPEHRSIDALREAARCCRGCALYEDAEQTVFGAGARGSAIMFVGEQPGDQEDRSGQPFVGPAGRLLDRALAEAGIDRELTYVTNAVKHFKFSRAAAGKRRIHQKPGRTEIVACRPWLIAEIAAVDPDVIVCLGATAGQALLGPSFRVSQQRGQLLTLEADAGDGTARPLLATTHPSAVLRAPGDRREQLYDELVTDFRTAAGPTARRLKR